MYDIKKVKLALLAMQRHSWEQGVTMQAFLEQGDVDVVVALAKEAAYRRGKDGRTALMRESEGPTDPCSVGEAMIFAQRETGDPDLKEALAGLEKWALTDAPRSPEGIVYHVISKPEFWVDCIYMFPPYLCAIGQYAEAMKQLRGNWDALFDPQKKLLSHMWDDGAKKFLRKAFWGVGNGWTVAGIARVIDKLPASMAREREELIGKDRLLIDSLLTHMRPDGYFHDVVDDPTTFVETNLTQMLAYGIFRGVASGWLDKDEYLPKAHRLREAALAKVDRYGLVQDVCGAPHFNKAGVAPEGNAFHLLMEAAAHKV